MGWVIRGYDSSNELFGFTFPDGTLSEAEAIGVLQRMASKHLAAEEIFGASRPTGHEGRYTHLDVHKSQTKMGIVLSTNGNPHFTARLED